MKKKLAGLTLLMGMSLAAYAETYHFTPIIDTNNTASNSLAVQLGNQLTMDVTSGANNTALFTFSNTGSVNSVLSRVYFDDSPSDLFSDISVVSGNTASVDFREVAGTPLPGGNIPTFVFSTTDQFNAASPQVVKGVNNGGAGEFLTLSAVLNGGRTFADVISSLNAGDETDKNFLRVGLRVISVEGLNTCDCGMSYLDKGGGGGASPPPPIPEPETYGMLMAGRGLLTALGRRRQKKVTDHESPRE